MALPSNGSKWPPNKLDNVTTKFTEWSDWWTGSTSTLTSHTRPETTGMRARLTRWWHGNPATYTPAPITIPIAADLATVASEQLYADPPKLQTDSEPADETLAAIINDGLFPALIEGAEAGAALGGRFHAVTVDPAVYDGRPFLTTIHADQAYPEFTWGVLKAVTFAWEFQKSDYTIYRHLERHELDQDGNGIILHGLYEGTRDGLGHQVPLTDHPATASLEVNEEGRAVDLPATPGLWCAYFPHAYPQRRWRKHPVARYYGRSIYDGVEPLMARLNQTWNAWMEEVDLAKGRIIVDEALLERPGGLGTGTVFDTDRAIFTALPGGLGNTQTPLQVVQFAIRHAEYAATCAALTDQIIRSTGWSRATFGEHDGDADVTATEVRAREKRTLSKRARQITEETPALQHVLGKLLDLAGHPGVTVTVEWPDTTTPTQNELIQSAVLLASARAASTYTLVEMVHPDWTPEQVETEVARITRGETFADPDLTQWGGHVGTV